MNLHQYYMDIINCMPNIVYWIDRDGLLKGCNQKFIHLLGLNDMPCGTPYEHMARCFSWHPTCIESMILNDKAVLMSGVAEHDKEHVQIDKPDELTQFYTVSRMPLRNDTNQIIGLVVVLCDISKQKKLEELIRQSTPVTRNLRSDKPIRVLLVEDNIIAQHVQQAILTQLNCAVDIAGSGDTASILFEPGKYELVLMDIGLQDTSGYIVSKTFREMEKNTPYYVPIVALTAYQAHVVKDDCNDYFMDSVLTKPLTTAHAIKLLDQYVYQSNKS